MGRGRGYNDEWSTGQWCCCGWASFFGFSLAIITIVLCALSLPTINEGEQALRYDDIPNKLYPDVLTAGLQTVHPDTTLIRYPTRYENNDIEMICRTRDGIEIQLSITFQYTFLSSNLAKSFLMLGEKDKNDEYMNYYAMSTIYKVCSQHDAVNFTEARGQIEYDMSIAINNIMNITNTVMGPFQLRNFVYPEAFQSAVNAKQQTLQQIEIVTRQRNATITEANTQLIQAGQRVEIQINNANADTERLLREASLASQTILAQWNQTIISIDAEMTNIGLTFEEYIDYLNHLLIGSAQRGIVRING